MEPLAKVIVYPILRIVYVALPCLSRPHSSLPSFRRAFPQTIDYFRMILEDFSPNFCKNVGVIVLLKLASMATAAVTYTFAKNYWDFCYGLEAKCADSPPYCYAMQLLAVLFWGIIVPGAINIITMCLIVILSGPFILVAVIILPIVVLLAFECLLYLLALLFYLVTRSVAQLIIFGLKNRRACQFLSALAAVVLGVTNAKVFAAIPISLGVLLSVPDLEPDPWVLFKLRFAKFLEANMDAESVHAFVHSKSFKLVSCNEMMPELGPVRSITPAASFVFGQFSSLDEHFNVEAEYRIGLGSITTSMRGDVIDVHIFTPFSGVKKRTIANTARSRYNLDMSARFWKEYPHVGILNKAFERDLVYEVGEFHCIGVDKWIKLCGSEYLVFVEYDSELGTVT